VLRLNIMVGTCLLTLVIWFWYCLGTWIFFQVQPFANISLEGVLVVFRRDCGCWRRAGASSGITQAAVVVVLQPMGYGFDEALAVGIAIHLGRLLITATIGAILLAVRSTGLRQAGIDSMELLRNAKWRDSGDRIRGISCSSKPSTSLVSVPALRTTGMSFAKTSKLKLYCLSKKIGHCVSRCSSTCAGRLG
jgi:hypothetical protein